MRKKRKRKINYAPGGKSKGRVIMTLPFYFQFIEKSTHHFKTVLFCHFERTEDSRSSETPDSSLGSA
jgi:hypothetical protein